MVTSMNESGNVTTHRPDEANTQHFLVEYTATQDAYLHYDNYSWHVGAVLIAGITVLWGFIIEKAIQSETLEPIALAVTLLMSVWMFYAHHNRQIYLSKLHRIWELEDILGFQQHRRWRKAPNTRCSGYRTFGPNGHVLDLAVYWLVSLGTVTITFFAEAHSFTEELKFWSFCRSPWVILVAIATLTVSIVVFINERRIKTHLDDMSAGATPQS